ncbi:hypothetical protein [Streptomyces sp. NPDC096012]|uniref:hypothetical protein n=1 Tax=Streptomyces sp. NPDC096012 TaxID=3155684 RepID=UPI003369EBA2
MTDHDVRFTAFTPLIFPIHSIDLYDEHPQPVDNFPHSAPGPGMLAAVGGA